MISEIGGERVRRVFPGPASRFTVGTTITVPSMTKGGTGGIPRDTDDEGHPLITLAGRDKQRCGGSTGLILGSIVG
jgi:hypothetical protein